MKLTPLTTKDYQRYKHFFKHQRYRLCGYSLPSMIVWRNEEYHPCAMVQDDALIIGTEFRHQQENRHLLLPISPEKEAPPEDLRDLAHSLGHGQFWFVPEDYIDQFGKDRIEALFRIEPHGPYDDYVYLQKNLADLGGNRYSKKRNLINQFLRRYSLTDQVQVEEATSADADECAEFIEAWCEERECEADEQSDLACEKLATLNAIWQMDQLEINALLLRIDGKICAFGVGSYLTDEMGVLHFEKAFSRIKGLYQYFDRECARQLFKDDTYINKESDMGEANLAKAKKSYHPVSMVRAYKLRLR